MKFKGNAWKFGADVDTDAIIPARYLNTSDPQELAKHCMEDSTNPDVMKKMKPGDSMIADKPFGCGSSREHAPIAIKAAGVSCVVAKSFARIFYRNCFNMGLPIFESLEAVDGIKEGDQIEVDADAGVIRNLSSGKTFKVAPVPDFMQELIAAGGLMAYTRKKAGLR
jgi:3-isopropylmalate dehydratase small subunit